MRYNKFRFLRILFGCSGFLFLTACSAISDYITFLYGDVYCSNKFCTEFTRSSVPYGEMIPVKAPGPNSPEENPEFYIDKVEVTVQAYWSCVDSGMCEEPGGDNFCNWEFSFFKTSEEDIRYIKDHPVNCVSWYDARDFCKWAGKRLPTEEEWEIAASAGRDAKYPWGNEEPSCNFAVMYDQRGPGCGYNNTSPVCSKQSGSSSLGACDMGGNVLEWTDTWYGDDRPVAPAVKGGAWTSSDAADFLISRRGIIYPRVPRSRFIGFRCVK